MVDDGADASPQPGLTREAIAQAALRVLEREGIDGLSMRKVGAELGVKAASLYWHVRNKEQLLDLLTDALMADAEPRPARAPGATSCAPTANSTGSTCWASGTRPRSPPADWPPARTSCA